MAKQFTKCFSSISLHESFKNETNVRGLIPDVNAIKNKIAK